MEHTDRQTDGRTDERTAAFLNVPYGRGIATADEPWCVTEVDAATAAAALSTMYSLPPVGKTNATGSQLHS